MNDIDQLPEILFGDTEPSTTETRSLGLRNIEQTMVHAFTMPFLAMSDPRKHARIVAFDEWDEQFREETRR